MDEDTSILGGIEKKLGTRNQDRGERVKRATLRLKMPKFHYLPR